mmetsp:Transcript_7660/g.19182  ORF Transcript_7660/g.19182 Transcript_7660/m.19182 type:complete len:232 (-) Transcript_7660:834-1529(-)
MKPAEAILLLPSLGLVPWGQSLVKVASLPSKVRSASYASPKIDLTLVAMLSRRERVYGWRGGPPPSLSPPGAASSGMACPWLVPSEGGPGGWAAKNRPCTTIEAMFAASAWTGAVRGPGTGPPWKPGVVVGTWRRALERASSMLTRGSSSEDVLLAALCPLSNDSFEPRDVLRRPGGGTSPTVLLDTFLSSEGAGSDSAACPGDLWGGSSASSSSTAARGPRRMACSRAVM